LPPRPHVARLRRTPPPPHSLSPGTGGVVLRLSFAPMAPPVSSERAPEQVPFRSFVRYFLWLGTFGFGGPIATVGYMQRDLVEKRQWLDREEFLNGVALGQTMPGPLAAQVAMWVGFLQRGALGALAVALAFVLPSF